VHPDDESVRPGSGSASTGGLKCAKCTLPDGHARVASVQAVMKPAGPP